LKVNSGRPVVAKVSILQHAARVIDIRWSNGIFLPEEGFHLDPHFAAPRAFVSHAHSDHTGRHEETLCTPATAQLMRARLGSLPGSVVELGCFKSLDWHGTRVTLLPAGHVLGSAQLHLETAAGSLLYTGDFKVRSGLSCEAAQFRRAETLVMETTYGRPKYVFPPTDEILRQVVQFCHETLEDGERPVLLGYSLGKAQEIMASLAGAGLRIFLHPAVWKMTELYRTLGVNLPEAEKLESNCREAGVFIGPPHLRGSKFLASIPGRRVAFLSGWAMEPGAIHRYACDAAFPLSDHADYADLLRAVEEVAPRRVLTVHGFASDFARDLRARGIDAWALTGTDQLELGIEEKASRHVVAEVPRTEPRMTGSFPRSGFGRFCQLCEETASHSGRLAKVRGVADFFRRLRESELVRCAVWLTGVTFPRGTGEPLGVGPGLLRKALQQASGEPAGVVRQVARQCGETGRAAMELLAATSGTRRPEIGDVQAFFLRLQGTGSSLERLDLLTDWLSNLPALEACYLIKLCGGDLRIGMKESLVEEALALAFEVDAEAVRRANMLTGDLGKTASLARNNRLDAAAMTLFRPLSCMLAGVEHDDSILWQRFAVLPGFPGYLWAEEKMDGVRAQLHTGGGRAEIFSRDGKSLSAAFPEIVETARQIPVSCVLDGEILAWQGNRPLAFADLQKRLGRKEDDLFFAEEIPVRFQAFDCLYLGDRLLLNKPLRERRLALESLPLAGNLGLARVLHPETPEAVEAVFREVRAAGHEGLVIKDPESPYTPGRRGLAWIKRKRALATLDVVVVAVEYGHGKRAGVLSDYTFAVQDDAGHFLVIGKAYTGLTDAEIARMTEVFLGLARRKQGRRIEVRPEIVIEVAFDSIRESGRHPSGLAMRFPRIKRLRPDKNPSEINTLADARALLVAAG
jgi:DNA ligase 1